MLLWVISSTSLNMFTRLIILPVIFLATGTPSNLLHSDSHTRWISENEQFSPQFFQDFQISNGDQEPVDLRFEQFGIQDGLSMSSIQALSQDQIGFLWIGAGVGLNKYDGYDFTILEVNPDDPNSLTGEDISSLYTDSQDNLWIGTDIGLDRMHLPSGEITQFRNVPHDRETLTAGQVNAILEDRSGDIWIGTYWGLSRFDPQAELFTRFLPENNISDLYEDQHGLIWIASNLGLISWNPERERFTVYLEDPEDPHSLSSNAVTAVEGDGAGNLWVGTGYGLNYFDTSSGEFKRYLQDASDLPGMRENSIMDILHDSRGRTWVGTLDGLNLYDPGSDEFHCFQYDPAVPGSLSNNIITTLLEDRSGVIWIGTLSGGLNKLSDDHNRFQLFPPILSQSPIQADPVQTLMRESLHATLINDLQQDRHGDLWIATILDGLYRFDQDTGIFSQFNYDPEDPSSLSGDSVNSIFEDKSGQLWVGTGNGLNRYDRQADNFERFPTFARDSVGSIAQDEDGDLWVATNGGLFRLFLSNGELLIEKKSFAADEPSINELFFDSMGAFWIGTPDGAYVRFPGDQDFTHFAPDLENPGSLDGHLVYTIYEDLHGTVWIGTIFGGLNRFNPSTHTFTSYTTEDGLPGDWLACILEDRQGYLWLGTNHGLSQFDPETETFRNYDSQDGIQGGEFFSCTETSDGKLYFGGLQGINAFYPGEITQNNDPPPVVITRFNLFNQPHSTDLQPDQQMELHYNENFISFDYAALDYNAPDNNQYAYMLEGLDQEWIQVGSRRHAEYPALEPGEYTFRVKASNNDGVWNEDGASVNISIQPPFWETTWFRGLVLLLLAGAVYAGYQLRVRNLQARSRELEEEVDQRTRELNERTAEAEQRQAEIEALYKADEELYRYLRLDHVLNALLETALEIMRADKGLLVIWDENHASLEINASTGFQPETIDSLVFTPGEGNVGTVAVQGESIIIEDTAADPEISQQLVEVENIRSTILVPIKIDSEIFGVFSVDYVESHSVSSQELRLLEALAQRTALAIENARLYEQAQALAALEERNRLARDLHDSVTQTLFGASMFADTAENQLSTGHYAEAADTITKLGDTTRDALGEMRLLIYELRPPVLEEEGLAAALVSRLDTVEQRSGMQSELDIEDIAGLSPEDEQQVYSIAIEALNNILKHAKAEEISITLRQEQNRLLLQIKDDGIGFNLASARESGGLGLIGMEERAEALGAQLSIETQPGQGTILQLTMEMQS